MTFEPRAVVARWTCEEQQPVSTGFELVPLAIGGLYLGAKAIYNGVNGAYERAREQAEARDLALEQATVSFATDMKDIELAAAALEASGLTVSRAEDSLTTSVDGHEVRLQLADDGALHLIAPLLLGEEAAGSLAVDLDTEYRKLVQGRTYQHLLEHARGHGMTVSDEVVEDDGSITITLDV
jgi:hypothetical protein